MLSSIHPLGERGRNQSYLRAATGHLLGAAGAGALFGALLGALGPAAPGWVAALVVLLAVGLDVVRWVPTHRRQVDEGWSDTYRDWVRGLGWGAQLGVGEATIVTTAAVHATWLLALFSGRGWSGALIGLAFGAVRGGGVFATRRVHDPDALRALFRRIEATAAPARTAGLVALTVAALLVPIREIAF